ncbi:MAG TPA: hypothetical protein VHZ50_03180, partial [Puia sp.]|nr:hypothetical protein [Puia sp.]
LPLLVQEKFCCAYYLYWLKFLNQKPRNSYLRVCKFSEDKPVLSFVLKFYGDYFLLFAEIHVNGELLKTNDWSKKSPIVLFDEKNGLCYLMQSVQDDDLYWWMLTTNSRLTILKEHFIEFHHTFLEQISICYNVNYVNRSGKKQNYLFNEVLKEALLNTV